MTIIMIMIMIQIMITSIIRMLIIITLRARPEDWESPLQRKARLHKEKLEAHKARAA